MADNIAAKSDATTTVGTLASDDIGGIHYIKNKLVFGANDSATDVVATAGLPVEQQTGATWAVDLASSTVDVMLGTDFSGVFGSSSLVATDGSTALTIGVQVLGTDGTNAQIVATNSSGHVLIADGGNTITVDGTVTANLGATDNAVLDDIAAWTSNPAVGTDGSAGPAKALSIAGTAAGGTLQELLVDTSGHAQVDIIEVGTPTQSLAGDASTPLVVLYTQAFNSYYNGGTWDLMRGDSTNGMLVNLGSNNDVTLATLPDTAAGDLATISSDTTSIDSNTTTIAGAVSGTEMQADLVLTGSVVDAGNSSTANLGNGAVFTGTSQDCQGYAAITVSLFSDQNSATDGMQFQFSQTDSWGADTDTYSFTMTANEARRFQFPVTARYFRVKYTNGASTTTDLDIQTMLHPISPGYTSIHRIEDNVSTDRSVELNKSAIMAQVNGSGDFIPIQSTASGVLKIGGAVEVDTWTAGTLTVDLSTNNDVQGAAAEGAAVSGNPFLIAGDDGTNVKHVAVASDGAVHIDDGGNAITVDWNGTAPPIGAGTEATALRVTVATDSTGVLSVDDNSGSLTVDATQLDVDDLAATADNVGAALLTNVIHDGTTALTPKFAVIDAATSGDNSLVSAVAGKKIRVLACFLQAAGTVNVRFEDGAGGTALTGQMNNVANTGFVLPFNPVGWFETGVNTALSLELSASVSVDGCLTYVEV